MTSYEEYFSGNTNVYSVYFENNGKYMTLDKNNNLKMVDSKDKAKPFCLEDYCNSSAMRMNFNIVKSKEDTTPYRFSGDVILKKPIQLSLSTDYKTNEVSDFYMKYYFNDKTFEVDRFAFLAEKKDTQGSNNHYAFDNYGDGNVVWFNTNPDSISKYNTKEIEVKRNQMFNIIRV